MYAYRAIFSRSCLFLLLWVVLIGNSLINLAVGLLVAASATWVSLQLLPPQHRQWHYAALAKLLIRFAQESTLGGWDVARRALTWPLNLRPGFIAYPLRLPSATACNTFSAFTSVLPGTLPTGSDTNHVLIYHCLDVTQPVAQQLDIDQALMMDILGVSHAHP